MKMEFQRKEERMLLPEPGKTPREDTAAVMKFYKLPRAFPPAVLAEAEVPVLEAEVLPAWEASLRTQKRQ